MQSEGLSNSLCPSEVRGSIRTCSRWAPTREGQPLGAGDLLSASRTTRPTRCSWGWERSPRPHSFPRMRFLFLEMELEVRKVEGGKRREC